VSLRSAGAQKGCEGRADVVITRRALLGSAAGFVALGAYAFGIEPHLRLAIARYALKPEGWPAGLKLRIVALADIHACTPWMTPARIAGLVDTANGLGGDIMLLLGDYMAGMRRFRGEVEPDAVARVLGALRAPLGVHAILGNHDWWEDDAAMRRATPGPVAIGEALRAQGIALLNNDAVRLVHGGKPFWLAGLGDQMAYAPVQRRAGRYGDDDLAGTIARLTDDAPTILMAHEPDVFRRIPRQSRPIALTLSGHTHGGQFNLFGWRPAAGSPGSRLYPRGHFREAGRDLIVSSGLGCSIMPMRVGVPPEIMVIDLGA
jgi:uncharacterized protein